jgi:hypothetical protein
MSVLWGWHAVSPASRVNPYPCCSAIFREGHLLLGVTNLSLFSSRVNVAIAAILLL